MHGDKLLVDDFVAVVQDRGLVHVEDALERHKVL